jgi:arabinogalactan oligomer/maltooligosaccharide transport system permease protein
MAVITYYPMGFNVWMSFTDYGLTNLRVNSPPPNIVGLDNYLRILQGDLPIPNFDFLRMLFFNLWWTFSNVIFHVTIGIIIAVLLNIEGLWFRKVYRAIFVLPMVIPALVIANVWKNMYDPDYGAVNQLLASVGSLFGAPASAFHIRWLESVDHPIPGVPLPLSYFAMLITNIWLGWPFMTIVATGALQSISKDFYEAASIDGASPVQQFFSITLPLLRPAMIPAAMFGMITTFNLFHIIYFISGGGPLRETEILVTTAFRLVNEQRLYGVAAAFGVYIFFILLALTVLTNRISRATESYDV